VPIGIYRYVKPSWRKLDLLLSQLEADSGLPVQRIDQSATLTRKRFTINDSFAWVSISWQNGAVLYLLSPNPTRTKLTSNGWIHHSNQMLHFTAHGFGLPRTTSARRRSVIERCRRLEAGWTYIYREDLQDLKALSPLDGGLADWIAEEASLRMLHMRLVESFVAVTGTYVLEKPTFERFAETALLMFEYAWIKGDKLPHRPRLGQRWVQITVGEPLSVTERWPTYQTSHQAARLAAADLIRTKLPWRRWFLILPLNWVVLQNLKLKALFCEPRWCRYKHQELDELYY